MGAGDSIAETGHGTILDLTQRVNLGEFPQPQTSGSAQNEFRRGDDHLHRFVGGEHILVSLRRAEDTPFFALSITGATLWDALAEWMSLELLVTHLQKKYEVEEDVARPDVEEFLQQLSSIGALHERPAAEKGNEL